MTAGERYADAVAAIVRRLPRGLSRVVAPTLLGFALINGATFALDLGLLWTLHGPAALPLAASVTLAYATALAVSYALNRTLNFRSHAPVGRQLAVYAAVVALNYGGCVLGVTAGLAAAGLDYRPARLLAGLCEAGFMYLAMRHVVFRDAVTDGRDGPVAPVRSASAR
ncbi:GtrA family protein [Jatrophihabitans fulvus]